MESFYSRHRHLIILIGFVFVQVLALAVQVKRPEGSGPSAGTRLIRYWAISAVAPIEKVVMSLGHGSRELWHGYVNLRSVHEENRQLKAQIQDLRLQQSRLAEEATQANRLQLLLGFKERFISETVAAQVIGSSGSDQSRVILIDKGRSSGLREDMPVIAPEGIIGKVFHVYPSAAQVLVINDQSSGVGAILEKSRLQGILNGTASGSIELHYIMADEKVSPGERVLTSGDDRIFPKGLVIGEVEKASIDKDRDTFLAIQIKPAVNLAKLEEVLVVTRINEAEPAPPSTADATDKSRPPAIGVAPAAQPARAADILALRLPGVPPRAVKNEKPAGSKDGNSFPAAEKKQRPTPPKHRSAQQESKPASPVDQPF